MAVVRSAREIGALVRAERDKAGLTQAQLADRAQVSRRWLIATESGEHPRAEVSRLLRVFDALGLAVTLTSNSTPVSTAVPVADADLANEDSEASLGRDVDLNAHLASFKTGR